MTRYTEEVPGQDGFGETGWNSAQREAIWAEANRILADPSFKKSRRCVSLFRRLVEHALEGGDEDAIKERTLGIEVFGREADYDTNTDPIVRMTANEIRKRLAQYYQSSTGHRELSIRLVPGSYIPHFDFSPRVVEIVPSHDSHPKAETLEAGSDVATEKVAPRFLRILRRNWLLVAAAVLVAAAGATVVLYQTGAIRSRQYAWWSPLLNSPAPVTICVADTNMVELHSDGWAPTLANVIATRQPPAKRISESEPPVVPFVDVDVSAHFAGWMQANGKSFVLRRSTVLTLEEMRRGPVILIGAFDNTWNLVLLSGLRYHVQVDPATQAEWIEDAQNPGMRDWKGSGTLLYSASSVDYAILTRVMNQDTGQWIVAAGGLGMHGTKVAGDLLTDPALANMLPAEVRNGKKNVQIVIKTTVIEGHTGAPQILAVHTW
jgi:hypothetical protein